MRDPSEITPLQVQILRVMWDRGSASSSEVRAGLADVHRPGRTTMATTLARMEKYGWLERVKKGRHFEYRAAVSQSTVRGSQVSRVIRALFPEDLPSLVSHTLNEGDWDEGDLDRIDALIAEYRRQRSGE